MFKNFKLANIYHKLYQNKFNLLIWTILFLANFIWIFSFKDMADFRDTRFIVNKTFSHPFYTYYFLHHKFLYFWLQLNMPIILYWKLFYSFIFSFGVLWTFIYLKKIVFLLQFKTLNPLFLNTKQQIIQENFKKETNSENSEKINQINNLNKIFKNSTIFNLQILLLSLLLFYNPYMLERFFMGHYFVLIGQIWLIPSFYFLFKWFILGLSKIQTNQQTDKNLYSNNFNIKQIFIKSILDANFIKLFLSISLSQFLSIHHGIFFYFLLIDGFLVLLFLKLYYFLKERNNFWKFWTFQNFKTKLLEPFLQVFIILFFNLSLFLGNYLYKSDFYFDSIFADNSKDLIIKNFSLQTFSQNWLEHLIVSSSGKGNWMSPLYEITQIKNQLGNFTDLTFYYNFFLILATFLIVILLILNFIYSNFNFFNLTKKSSLKTKLIHTKQLSSLLIQKISFVFLLTGLLLTWLLNFGYSNLFFETINKWFYLIPISYTFREPGKFYAFFSGLLMILLGLICLQSFQDSSQTFKKIQKIKINLKNYLAVFSLFLLTFSNLIPFFLIPKDLNYVQYPKIFDTINQDCSPNDKILFFPTALYIIPSYSKNIFTLNPGRFYFKNCDFFSPEKVILQDFETGGNILLSQTVNSQELDDLVNKLMQDQMNFRKFNKELKKFMKKNGLNQIVVETHTNNTVKKINQALQFENQPHQTAETIFWYKFERLE
jgi:hypothetical protein